MENLSEKHEGNNANTLLCAVPHTPIKIKGSNKKAFSRGLNTFDKSLIWIAIHSKFGADSFFDKVVLMSLNEIELV
jgi:hypothetical protein